MPLQVYSPIDRDIVVVHSSDLHVDHDYTARIHGGDGTAGLACVLEKAGSLGADVVFAQAEAAAGSATGSSVLGNLTLNGVPVAVSGAPNQTISIPGGRLIINEQTPTAGGIVVNALHLVVDGAADVVLGSATAAVQ